MAGKRLIAQRRSLTASIEICIAFQKNEEAAETQNGGFRNELLRRNQIPSRVVGLRGYMVEKLNEIPRQR